MIAAQNVILRANPFQEKFLLDRQTQKQDNFFVTDPNSRRLSQQGSRAGGSRPAQQWAGQPFNVIVIIATISGLHFRGTYPIFERLLDAPEALYGIS